MLYAFRATVEGKKVTFLETNPVEGKYEAIVILTTPLRTESVSPADQPISQSLPPVPQADTIAPTAGVGSLLVRTSSIPTSSGIRQGAYADPSAVSSRLSTVRGTVPVISDPGLSTPVNNNLSLLYHDKMKRDERFKSSLDDIFVDVNGEAYQRFMQGDRSPLVFEKSGNHLNSTLILVENCSQLYINFYQFNEGKKIPPEKEKILSHIFEIRGELPNCVKGCKPALMVPQNGGYVIKNKGLLVLEGAV